MAGEFKGGGHLRDAYGREVFTIATLNDPLDPNDVQAGGDVLTLDGKSRSSWLTPPGRRSLVALRRRSLPRWTTAGRSGRPARRTQVRASP
jgi:hypothetical protein